MNFQRVVRLPDASEVADVVAHHLMNRLLTLQAAQGVVHVCLTGGDTANLMYERFAELVPGSELDATKLQLWWGDERFVPATDPSRNSLQAVTRLARTVAISSADIHMMPAADGRKDPYECAADYASELGDTTFDIILLGIGADGHVGSIFPGHASFEATSKTVVGVTDAPKPPAERISLTIPTMRRADEAWFIATGETKAGAVASAINGDEDLPATHVHGKVGTYWFIDDEAGCELPPKYRCDTSPWLNGAAAPSSPDRATQPETSPLI